MSVEGVGVGVGVTRRPPGTPCRARPCRAPGERPLRYFRPPQHGEEEQRVPLRVHPRDQRVRAFGGSAKEREEEEEGGQGLLGTTQVEVQGDQGSEKAGGKRLTNSRRSNRKRKKKKEKIFFSFEGKKQQSFDPEL